MRPRVALAARASTGNRRRLLADRPQLRQLLCIALWPRAAKAAPGPEARQARTLRSRVAIGLGDDPPRTTDRSHRALQDHRCLPTPMPQVPATAPQRPGFPRGPMPFRSTRPPFTPLWRHARQAPSTPTLRPLARVQPWHAGRATGACAAPLPEAQFLAADPRVVRDTRGALWMPRSPHGIVRDEAGQVRSPPKCRSKASGWPRARQLQGAPGVRPAAAGRAGRARRTVLRVAYLMPLRLTRRWGPTRRSQA